MNNRSGFILLELLVSLAVFGALAVITATIAQRTILQGKGIREEKVINRYLERIRRPERFDRLDGTQEIRTKKFNNGDRWKVFEYRPDGRGETHKLPVFLPAKEDQTDTETNEPSL